MGGVSTSLGEVLTVLDTLARVGCASWLEGGWALDALADVGYAIETDWLPNRVELAAPGRGFVDLHPLLLEPDGSARQAALDGGFHVFPAVFFTVGSLDGVAVPCVSAQAQRLFHNGYPARPVDSHDLALIDGLTR